VSYQVLARKWRPQRFDEVVGQKGVTQTLRNAIGSGRLAQAFVFAGARGVGKTTTARILARALNCENGPTAEPCGVCDMCVEIAEGRDLDVLEIDAATHTGVDNVRDVIIDGLAIRPVRDRYKIFIIDEVHQLSNSSFNALLKSMEEPPPHVVFMMATTELHKIPDTILSRAQVYEFRTIGTRPIADQLRKIADAEGVTVDDAALALVARAAEGSMRDAQSAFDQVLAFGSTSIDVDQVSMVLGLVARDLLLDIVDVVAREDAPAVFDLAARVVESGQDLKHVCRELARLVRDLMILQVDPGRTTSDPEYAVEGDRARLDALAAAFSREDLLRAFDLIAKLETDLRSATQPRYHLEMALLRWIHLRRLLPIAELIDAVEKNAPLAARPGTGAGASAFGGGSRPAGTGAPPIAASSQGARPAPPSPSSSTSSLVAKLQERAAARPAAPGAPTPSSFAPSSSSAPSAPSSPSSQSAPARPSASPSSPAASAPPPAARPTPPAPAAHAAPAAPAAPAPSSPAAASYSGPALSGDALRDTFLAEVKKTKAKFLYNTLIASARRVEVADGVITFVFGMRPSTLQGQFEAQRASLEEIATSIAGRPMRIATIDEKDSAPGHGGSSGGGARANAAGGDQEKLKAAVMAEPAVQAMLDVFPAEIKDVEEM
jgi:DNA polymerase III subunit gamma/tau